MHAIMVCVDYADILSVTLPKNRHHFPDGILVVTSRTDEATRSVCALNGVAVLSTDSFYRHGALFNKWAGLEEGLRYLSARDCGWLCIMDADVVWPRVLPDFKMIPGNLYTPFRRMMHEVDLARVDDEQKWGLYPTHRQEREFAGYSQIFHTSDPVLGPLPWHQLDWTHAGGADSFFQTKWGVTNKVRPPFEVLHLGPAGVNWAGRASEYLDGTRPPEGMDREITLRRLIGLRRDVLSGDRFRGEKLSYPSGGDQ